MDRLSSGLALHANWGARWRVTSVLVPLDFKEDSWSALGPVAWLIRDSSCTVTLLHVVHLNIVGEERGVPLVQFVEEMKRAAEQTLQAVATLFPPTRVRVAVRAGEPVDTIAREADEAKADLIILPRGRRPKRWNFFGRSVVDRLVDRTACPVLVVP